MDLVALVPDADWEATVHALLGQRWQALGIRRVSFRIIRHPRRDPGVRTQAAPLLRSFIGEAEYALVVLDLSGSGSGDSASQLEREVEVALRAEWQDRCAVVATDPELEVWVWSSSPHVATALRWTRTQPLRGYLEGQGFWPSGRPKPLSPKEAVEHVLRATRTPRTPAVYAEIAERVSLQDCTDSAFGKFRTVLQGWFPPVGPVGSSQAEGS